MDKLIRFLMDNPILLLILVAWVAGMIGNIGKAAKKARDRAEKRSAPPPQQSPAQPQPRQPPRARPVEPGTRSAEEVAAEMRRILGLEPEGKEEGQSEAPPPPSRQRPLSEGQQRPLAEAPQGVGRRDVVAPERPPTPVKPSTQDRRLAKHVDPHVGERIARRHSVQSGLVGKHEPGSTLGSLGGRVGETVRVRRTAVRFALDDLQKALVLNEILGKPLALRDPGDRFV